MADQTVINTVMSHGAKVARTHVHDWLILVLLVVIETILLVTELFYWFIGVDMMTDMKYPGLLFSVILMAVVMDAIKDAVVRPRPDFFYRCFPDGNVTFNPVTKDVLCHGDKAVIKEGYNPSGHTSWSFAGLSFLSFYLSGKIMAFDRRGHVAKLCIVLFPYPLAARVGVSRVDDYWHHWQNVFNGALIGTVISTFCYLQFFPMPYDVNDPRHGNGHTMRTTPDTKTGTHRFVHHPEPTARMKMRRWWKDKFSILINYSQTGLSPDVGLHRTHLSWTGLLH